MHPAFSVLIFTVTSGAGYGLLTWLGVGQLLGFTQASTADQQIILGVIAMVLVSIGLLSSTMHLANPKNAWRSFSRFRT
jgi:DMSO reductase anchor subunit